MLAHKSTACNRPKAILLQNISQLNQRIIIIAVAEGNHGHRIRTVALYLLRQIGKQYIRHTPCNDRCAADNQIPFAENRILFSALRQGKIINFQGQVQFLGYNLRRCFHCLFRSACRAEIHRPYFFQLHLSFSSFTRKTKYLFCSSYLRNALFSTILQLSPAISSLLCKKIQI